jgi:hypothetical protein
LFQKYDPFDDDEAEESDSGGPFGIHSVPNDYVSDEDSCDGFDRIVMDDEDDYSDSDIEDDCGEYSGQYEKCIRDDDEVWKVIFFHAPFPPIFCNIIVYLTGE